MTLRESLGGREFVERRRLAGEEPIHGRSFQLRYCGSVECLRHIIPIAHALFVGMARAHRIAAIIKDKTARIDGDPDRVSFI
jgi:hypothetical protein